MAYASRTRTRRNVAALAAAGWGWMVGPLDCGGPILGGMPWALDNGAWPAHAQGIEWDSLAFMAALGRYGRGADFVVVPDRVGDREATLAKAAIWLPRLLARDDLTATKLLIAVQDGMTVEDIEPLLIEPRIGIFIGGSTEWKEAAIIPWGRWAHDRGRYCHAGRVNTTRRINLCLAGKIKSIDGTSATKFAKTLPMLDGARRQLAFEAVR